MAKYLQFLYLIIGCVIAVCVHSYVTALASTRQGDVKPKKQNKLTLNPLTHIEPIGFICMLVSGGYGWGNPVNTSAVYYKDRKKNTLITYLTPIIVNLTLGIVFVVLGSIFLLLATENSQGNSAIHSVWTNLYTCFIMLASVNVKFALFNIIPVYPLAGNKILSVFVSSTTLVKLTNYEKLLQVILIFALVSGLVDGIISPFANVFLSLSSFRL